MSMKGPQFSLWNASIINNNYERNFDSFQVPKNDSINQSIQNDGEAVLESVKSKLDVEDSTTIPNITSPYLTHRQSSDSYSPCVSPIACDFTPKGRVPMISVQTYQDNAPNENDNFSARRLSQDLSKNGTHSALTKTTPEVKTLSQRRKEAQEVILSLWPYGVRYETYLEEGFKKDILDELFQDINIDNSEVPNVIPLHKNNSASEESNINSKIHSNDVLLMSDRDELTTKAASNSSVSIIPTKSLEVIEKEKPCQLDMAERHKTLQTKMDALRKSRELRASMKTGIKPKVDEVPGIKSQTDQNISMPTKKLPDVSLQLKQAPSSTETPDNPSELLIQLINGATSHSKLHTNVNKPEPTISAPPPPSTLSSETPAIPGLFLISNLANSVISENSETHRKRPVASDFDDQTVIPVPFKRPFGQNRSEQRVVINVSEDESEDEDISTEFETQVVQELSSKTSNIHQNLSSASNISGQKNFTSPINVSSNPSSLPAKQSLLAPSILKQKQREIELMKQRIAAAEAQLKAKSTTVGVGTQQHSESSVFVINENLDQDEVSSTELEAMQANGECVHGEIGPAITDHAQTLHFDLENSTSKTESLLEIKRRQKSIAQKLPIIESEVQKSKSKLEQLKIEISEVEAGLEKKIEEKNRMTIEMKRLCDEEAFLPRSNETSNEIKMNKSNLDHAELCSQQDLNQSPLEKEDVEIIMDKLSSADHNLLLPSLITSTESQIPQRETSIMTDTTIILDIDDDKINKDNAITPSISLKPDKSTQIQNFVNRELGDLIQKVNIIQAEIKENNSSSEATAKNICSSTPNQHTSKISECLIEEGGQSNGYILENDEADTYEGESDDYEPPDATSLDRASPVSPPFSPAPPESVELLREKLQSNVFKQLPQIGEQENISELQSLQNASASQHMKDEPNITLYSSDRYTPYQSPLKLYRAYRFHPNFRREVAGGLRSKTYSHNIDANKEFCRFEVAGGFCNDSACSLQHFKSITLPDDGIMAALGCPDEFTGDSREKFVAGLREVLLDLRLRKVNDFDAIASEIIAYRAKFLGDQSKILSLEDITI